MASDRQKRSERISFRATEKTVNQVSELQRILTSRLGTPVSQGQAVAVAVDAMLESFAANPKQGRLLG